MVTLERIDERGDELQELRERYNQLCATLAFGAGVSTAAEERLLQELQGLVQRIVAIEPKPTSHESSPSAPVGPTASGAPDHGATRHVAAPRAGNVIAFRVKTKGAADLHPGAMLGNDAPTPALGPGPGHGAKPFGTRPQPVNDARPVEIDDLRRAIVDQGEAILLISGRCDDNRARLMRIETQLAATTDLQQLSAEIAALRDGSQKQHEHLAELATAVHQLARRLVTASGIGASA